MIDENIKCAIEPSSLMHMIDQDQMKIIKSLQEHIFYLHVQLKILNDTIAKHEDVSGSGG